MRLTSFFHSFSSLHSSSWSYPGFILPASLIIAVKAMKSTRSPTPVPDPDTALIESVVISKKKARRSKKKKDSSQTPAPVSPPAPAPRVPRPGDSLNKWARARKLKRLSLTARPPNPLAISSQNKYS